MSWKNFEASMTKAKKARRGQRRGDGSVDELTLLLEMEVIDESAVRDTENMALLLDRQVHVVRIRDVDSVHYCICRVLSASNGEDGQNLL